MRCPYFCPCSDKTILEEHFKQAHPERLIKNHNYSILTEITSSPYREFLFNGCDNEIFLSKCVPVGAQKMLFSTTCLSAQNPQKYQLVFYPQVKDNPAVTLTYKLQTVQPEEMIHNDACGVVLDFVHITKKISYPMGLECRFNFENTRDKN